jgi:uncharacterized protein YbcV (DUF1398 family)
MFTIDQIREAHARVKSGADFPAYIQEIKKLGVHYYDVFVSDGHADYYGANDYKISGPVKYDDLKIAETANPEQFIADLKAHQLGKTDYPTFCYDCAKSGIEKWTVCLIEMVCTYYDKSENEILIEQIPQ